MNYCSESGCHLGETGKRSNLCTKSRVSTHFQFAKRHYASFYDIQVKIGYILPPFLYIPQKNQALYPNPGIYRRDAAGFGFCP